MSVTEILNIVAAIVSILGFFGVTCFRDVFRRPTRGADAPSAEPAVVSAGAVAPPAAPPASFNNPKVIKVIGFTLLALLALGNDLGGLLLFGFIVWLVVRWLKGSRAPSAGGAGWAWLRVVVVITGMLISVGIILAAIEATYSPLVLVHPATTFPPYGTPAVSMYPGPPPWYPSR